MRDYMDDDQGNDNSSKNKNISFGTPKWLLFVKKKNKKYEQYIFKKNAESFRTFFNISIIFFALAILLTKI